jgi:hypothetical protein
MIREYLEGEMVSSEKAFPAKPDDLQGFPLHGDDMVFQGDFGQPLGPDDEALMLQELLEGVEVGGQPGVPVEGDHREDFINQFISGGVVGGEFALAEVGEGNGLPPLLYGAEEQLTPWGDGDFLELKDLFFPIEEVPSWLPESNIQLQGRHSTNFPVQNSEQGTARRRSMLQMRGGGGNGPVPSPISLESYIVGSQSLPAMNMIDLPGSSSGATAHGSRPETGQHEQRSAERLSALCSTSFQSEDEVSSTRYLRNGNAIWN